MPRAGSSCENLVVEHFQNYIKKGEISDVINIYDSDVEEAPNIGKIKANKYIKNIAKIDKKVELLIDCEKLINE